MDFKKEEANPKESFRKRLDNFLYHYKYHVIAGFLIILLASSLIYTIIEGQIEKMKEAKKPEADIEIMLFGDYKDDDLSPFKKKVKEMFPDWRQIDIELVYAPDNAYSQVDMAAMQKNQITMAEAKPDIYIFDFYHFNKFIENGPFLALDQYENVKKDDPLFYQKKDDEQKHLYGIDITNNDLFSGLQIASAEKVAVIRTNSKNHENALAFIDKIIKKR